MTGIFSEHCRTYLIIVGGLLGLTFCLPMTVSPLGWARSMGWESPEKKNLTIYFGRGLGSLATALIAYLFKVLYFREPLLQIYELMLLAFTVILLHHIHGFIRKIQPIKESLEIPLFTLLIICHLLFYPVSG